MNCWKCGLELLTNTCACDLETISQIQDTLKRASQHSNNIDEGLANLREKIKVWRKTDPGVVKSGLAEDRDINRCIHFLCLMADELEEKIFNKVMIRSRDIEELEQKALKIAELARNLPSG